MRVNRIAAAAGLFLFAPACGSRAPLRDKLDPAGITLVEQQCRADGHGAAMRSGRSGDELELELGIGSIVHESDGTSDSFLAYEIWRGKELSLDRATRVLLIDHPVEADYSVTGVISGDIDYWRKATAKKSWKKGVIAGSYTTGFAVVGTFLILGIAGEASAGKGIAGGMLLLSPGLAANASIWSEPANGYAWDYTGHFVLRRRGIRIGQFAIRDRQRAVVWDIPKRLRAKSLVGLLSRAHLQIADCIREDLGETL